LLKLLSIVDSFSTKSLSPHVVIDGLIFPHSKLPRIMALAIGAKATESQNLIALSHGTIALASPRTTDTHTAPLSVASRDV